MKVLAIDHISIAVRNLEKAREAYERILGLELSSQLIMDTEKLKIARYRVGDMWLELMEDMSPDGEVAKFIQRRGEGIFTVSYRVANVDEALADLKSQGLKLIDEKPRHYGNDRYAFICHPKELCGVLTEVLDKEA